MEPTDAANVPGLTVPMTPDEPPGMINGERPLPQAPGFHLGDTPFKPNMAVPQFPNPAITISATHWLKSALWYLEVLDINVDTTSEVVNAEGHQVWRCNIAFDIPIRGVPAGLRTKVDLKGEPMLNQIDAEFNTVRNCLRELQHIGYQVPDYSLFKIWALCERSSDVAQVSERIARDNQIDVILLNNYTYAACGLQAILEQAIEQLGYYWNYDGCVDTTGGHQYRLKLTLELASNSLAVGYIYGQPCLRVCEARESALMWALKYIDIVSRYTIRDIHYVDWRQERTLLSL